LDSKICSAQYSGAKSLLGVDITFRGRVRKCPSGNVEVYLGCKGTDCFLLNSYKLCTSNAQCTPTTACGNIPQDIVSFFNNNYRNPYINYMTTTQMPSTTMNSYTTTYFPTTTYDITPNPNPYPKYKYPLGIYYPTFALFPFSIFYENVFKKDGMCYTNITTELFHDIKNVLRSLKDLPKDNIKNPNEKYMCSVDQQFIINANLTSWWQSELTIDVDIITLHKLEAWNIDANPLEVKVLPPPPPIDVNTPTDSGIVTLVSAISLLFMILL